MRLHQGLRQGELSPLSAHETKRFAGGKTLMPGGFSPPEQMKRSGFPQNGTFCGRGGMRASIYDAMPAEGVVKLCDFIQAFDKNN